MTIRPSMLLTLNDICIFLTNYYKSQKSVFLEISFHSFFFAMNNLFSAASLMEAMTFHLLLLVDNLVIKFTIKKLRLDAPVHAHGEIYWKVMKNTISNCLNGDKVLLVYSKTYYLFFLRYSTIFVFSSTSR